MTAGKSQEAKPKRIDMNEIIRDARKQLEAQKDEQENRKDNSSVKFGNVVYRSQSAINSDDVMSKYFF